MENNVVKRDEKRIVFMGTPEFAAHSFKELVEAGYSVVGCFTNPDRPSGRGMKLTMSPVKEYAISQNIPVFQPEKVRKNEEVVKILDELKPDLIVVVAYGKILPKEILEYPKFGCVNVHGSLLPKYRGAAPIQWSIINGEKVTGITTMFMDEGMDTGDMLLKEEVIIEQKDNFETLHDKLKIVGAKLIAKTLDGIFNNTIERIKQPDNFSIAPMIDKKMTEIDFNKTSEEIYNFVRGLSPYPGTYMKIADDRVIKVYEVEAKKSNEFNNYSNGEIVIKKKDELSIKCSDGYISLINVQPQGSKKMDIRSFLAGNNI